MLELPVSSAYAPGVPSPRRCQVILPRGEITWQRRGDGTPGAYALLTGSSSMHHALRCAITLAEYVGEPQPDWELAAGQLGHAVACHPEAFADKNTFSMDWYYPVLGGPLRGAA